MALIAVAHRPLGHPTALGIAKESSLLLVKTELKKNLKASEESLALFSCTVIEASAGAGFTSTP